MFSILRNRFVWLAAGLLIGLSLAGVWPNTPIHAVATDRFDTFAIATGPVDEEVEAIFFLDFLTGDLRAAVLGNQMPRFVAFYQFNILQHMGVDVSKNPRYLMVTGMADLRRGAARMRPSRCVVYVAEVTTGRVGAYAIPWSREQYMAGQRMTGALMPLDVTQFRTAAVRQGAAAE
jgi:hypothetical protein